MEGINPYICAVCRREHTAWIDCSLCCIEVKTIEPVKATADTNCKQCGRFIPAGFACYCHGVKVKALTYYQRNRDTRLAAANARYAQKKEQHGTAHQY